MATGEPAASCSMPARSFCGSGSSNHITPRSCEALGDLERRGQREDLAAVDHQLDRRRAGAAAARPGWRDRPPLRPDADLHHRHAAIEQRAQQLVVPGRRSLLEEHARCVDRHPVAGPAEQRRHRSSGFLADEVPQRDLDGAAGLQGRPHWSPSRRRVNRRIRSASRSTAVDLLADEQRGQRLRRRPRPARPRTSSRSCRTPRRSPRARCRCRRGRSSTTAGRARTGTSPSAG